MGTNALAHRTQMGETRVRKEDGVTVGGAIVGGAIVEEEEGEGTRVGVEGGEGMGGLAPISRVVATRRGTWGVGNMSSLL
jgi:hypothetical protein